MSRRVVAGTLVATVLAVGLAGCGHSSNGMARLTTNGQVQIIPAKGDPRQAHNGEVLHAGDRVEVTAGQAALSLVPAGVLQLRTGTQITVDTTPQLTGGAVLIQPVGRELRVAAQRATLVVPAGVAQLDVGSIAASLTAKVYQATSHLDIPGNPAVAIAAPRQITLTPETHLPVGASPLQYLDSDAWDHLYLATAMTVSAQLAAAANGFNAQLSANQGKDAAFYQQLLPALSGRSDFVDAFSSAQKQQPIGAAPAAKPGDYLIASVIAMRGTRGNLESRLSNELVFVAQGASWGFVAYDQGVTDLTGVLADVVAAIGRAALPFTGAPASQIAIGPPGGGTTPTTRPGTRPPPTTTPPTTIPSNPRPPRPVTTTTTPPGGLLPVPLLPGPLGSILNPLLDPLIQALNNILAGRG
jgi:hypothetical protein